MCIRDSYSGVMLQGFSWDSYDYSQWTVLEKQADDMKGFIDLVWLPPVSYTHLENGIKGIGR